MASKRAVRFLNLRTPQVLSTQVPALRFSAQYARIQVFPHLGTEFGRVQAGLVQQRWHSAFPSNKKSKVWQFQDVLQILENPSSSTLLIDVREPSEYEANTIPTSLNIPITSQPDALLLPDEDFEDRFGWQKPPRNKEIVFFCKAGVRSSAAAQLAKQAGYENVGEYRGSWLDWEKNGGPGTKSAPPAGSKGEPDKAEIKE